MPKFIDWASVNPVPIPANPRFIDLCGKKFGRLTSIELLEIRKSHATWRCKCDCGVVTAVRSSHLRYGRQVSCGCFNDENRTNIRRTHGDSRPIGPHKEAPEYSVWMGMKARCSNPKNRRWARYGGRGIKVCDRWLSGDGTLGGYQCFLQDMGRRPAPNHQIDRENNDKGYSPDNCRWALPKDQQRNRSTNKYVQYQGHRMALVSACEKADMSYRLVRDRLDRGWTFDRAISEPHRWHQ